jgi:hypothetical protein
MALSFGDVAMAFGTGVMKGASEDQKRRQERLDERMKELQKNNLEMAKSKHAAEYKQYLERKVKADALKASNPGVDRVATYMMNRGIDPDKAYKFAEANPNFEVPESAFDYGQEPLMDYDVSINEQDIPVAPNYLADSMRRVLGGGGSEETKRKSLEQQTNEVFSKKRDYHTPAQQANVVRSEQADLADVPVRVGRKPSRIQEQSIPATAYPIDTGYSMEGVTEQQMPAEKAAPAAAAPITAEPVQAKVVPETPVAEPVDYSSLYAPEPTAEMRNRAAVAQIIMDMDPSIKADEAEQKALALDNIQISPVTGKPVNKLNYILGRESGVEDVQAQRAIEQQPAISMAEAGKNITAYIKENPYNGTIENEADYVFDLSDMTRNIRSEFGLGLGQARNIAELMLLPDVDAISKKDTLVPNFLEENYTYDPANAIPLPLLRQAMRANPGKNPKEIILRIRERMRGAQ